MTTVTSVKCVKQHYSPTRDILAAGETFRKMLNDCLRIGLSNDASTLKKLSKLCYQQLSRHDVISYYKLSAISKATGILSNRKQSIKRGYPTREPYMKRPILISSYGFKVENGVLKVPLGERQYFDIPLNSYVRGVLSDPAVTVRSFTLTSCNMVSICYSKDIQEIECTTTAGVDRNLANVTYGNQDRIIIFDVSRAVKIA